MKLTWKHAPIALTHRLYIDGKASKYKIHTLLTGSYGFGHWHDPDIAVMKAMVERSLLQAIDSWRLTLADCMK